MNDVLLLRECRRCGEKLTDDEIEYPAEDHRGKPLGELICEGCFRNAYQFVCCKCDGYEYEEFQHRWLVVFEPTDCLEWSDEPVVPGIYEICNYPYFGGGMIGGGWLIETSLRKTEAKVNFADDGYPCGHLCRECVKGMGLEHSEAGSKFHDAKKWSGQ